MSSRQRSLEQERAKQAWVCVGKANGAGDRVRAEYGRLARGASADLQTNGLGQTLAFLRAKGYKNGRAESNGHSCLFEDLSRWVMQQLGAGDADLLTWVMGKASTAEYRRATAEAMAFAAWLKRFAEAELPTGGDDGR